MWVRCTAAHTVHTRHYLPFWNHLICHSLQKCLAFLFFFLQCSYSILLTFPFFVSRDFVSQCTLFQLRKTSACSFVSVPLSAATLCSPGPLYNSGYLGVWGRCLVVGCTWKWMGWGVVHHRSNTNDPHSPFPPRKLPLQMINLSQALQVFTGNFFLKVAECSTT